MVRGYGGKNVAHDGFGLASWRVNPPIFVHFFSMIFNIMSACFIHQLPLWPQIIDSREDLFWCKIGLACACGRMYIYVEDLPFAVVSELFAAKRSAFWCKMECVLVQNRVRFGAKWSAFWCKMKCVLVLNARQNGAKYAAKSINIHSICINKTFYGHEKHSRKGHNSR